VTIAIVLKVGDGVVLGADSAGSLIVGSGVVNVYNNSEKIVNLRKRRPIGMVTYGLGGLGGRSISRLAKDLRIRLTSGDDVWKLNDKSYTIGGVADAVKRFFYDELYLAEYPTAGANAPQALPVAAPEPRSTGEVGASPGAPAAEAAPAQFPVLGFLVVGFSANERKAEVWQVEVDAAGFCNVRSVFGPDEYGAEAKGQPDPIYRLLRGWSTDVLTGLIRSGIDQAQALTFLQSLPNEQLFHPAMPVQDAIDLVKYLAEVTAGFMRFAPRPSTVAGPIDLAAVTFHEGFRWVQRKHYYTAELNPDQQR
jgi:hypothetical protein